MGEHEKVSTIAFYSLFKCPVLGEYDKYNLLFASFKTCLHVPFYLLFKCTVIVSNVSI